MEYFNLKRIQIVQDLLESSREHGGLDLNGMALREYSVEDEEQFAQLIGYSVSGFGELSYVNDKTYNKAAKACPKIGKKVVREEIVLFLWRFMVYSS